MKGKQLLATIPPTWASLFVWNKRKNSADLMEQSHDLDLPAMVLISQTLVAALTLTDPLISMNYQTYHGSLICNSRNYWYYSRSTPVQYLKIMFLWLTSLKANENMGAPGGGVTHTGGPEEPLPQSSGPGNGSVWFSHAPWWTRRKGRYLWWAAGSWNGEPAHMYGQPEMFKTPPASVTPILASTCKPSSSIIIFVKKKL